MKFRIKFSNGVSVPIEAKNVKDAWDRTKHLDCSGNVVGVEYIPTPEKESILARIIHRQLS